MERAQIAAHYDRYAEIMENQPGFYDWTIAVLKRCGIRPEATICDLGCGTGALLRRLDGVGYRKLAGADFAPRCIELSRRAVPDALLFRHDIQAAPMASRYDVITMTTVIDFLDDPGVALRNVAASLAPGGRFIVSIRNRWAYWPFYYARGLADHLPSDFLRRWFRWFTTPLGMRRSDQPFEHVYSVTEARRLLVASGLEPVAEYGFQLLPMAWIGEIHWLMRLVRRVDVRMHCGVGKARCYWYFFVCEAAPAGVA